MDRLRLADRPQTICQEVRNVTQDLLVDRLGLSTPEGLRGRPMAFVA